LIIGEDAQTAIDFGTENEIDFKINNATELTLSATALYPVTDAGLDLGTASLEFKDAFFDGTVTSDAFAGPLTGAVTGNADTATTLATTRAIAVAGDVTGTANFNGSAAISITTTLASDAIVTANITNANVTGAKIAADAITGAKIANEAVNSEHLAAGSIDNEHIADDAVNSEHYATGSIDTGHIANDQITNALMADDAIGVAQLSATGTAGSGTFLRGDNAWAAVSAGATIATGTYTGDGGTSHAITGVGFSPKYLMIVPQKTASGGVGSYWTTDVINDDHATGVTINLYSAQYAYLSYILSIDSDGFTVTDNGVDVEPNRNSEVYNYLAIG
jgi:hypothetical protein